jgi:hypothetical protein
VINKWRGLGPVRQQGVRVARLHRHLEVALCDVERVPEVVADQARELVEALVGPELHLEPGRVAVPALALVLVAPLTVAAASVPGAFPAVEEARTRTLVAQQTTEAV